VRSLETAFQKSLTLLAAFGGIVLFLTALLIPVNVVLRACCRTSIFGLLDAVEYGLMATTFLAAPWVLMKNAHVAVDIAAMVLPCGPRRLLARAVNLFGMALSLVLFWYALQALQVSAARGSMIRKAFVIPEWWTLLAPVVCGALLSLEFLRRAVRRDVEDRPPTGL